MRRRAEKHKRPSGDTEVAAKSKKTLLNGDDQLKKAINCNDLLAVREILEIKDGRVSTVCLHDALLEAIKDGRKQIVRLLISYGIYIKRRSRIGCLALNAAARQGNLDIVKSLIRRGAYVDGKDSHGRTALMTAMENNCSSATLTYLLEDCKADVNLQDNTGKTALMFAVEQWDYEAVQILFFGNDDDDIKDYKCDEGIKDMNGRTAYDLAKLNGSADLMHVMSESRKQVCSPLSVAAGWNKLDLVRQLVEIHPSCVETLCFGEEPLTAAMHGLDGDKQTWDGKIHGSFELIEYLVHAGANVDACHICGLTPLMFAAHAGSIEIVRILLMHKANVNDTSYEIGLEMKRRTALMFAAQMGRVKIVEMLIQADAKLDMKDAESETALSFAALGNHKDCVLALLKKWAFLSQNDIEIMAQHDMLDLLIHVRKRWSKLFIDFSELQLVLCKAAKRKCYELVKNLIEYGVDVNYADKDFWRVDDPLHPLNSALEDIDMLTLLVEMGADINFQPRYGKTALMVAACNGNLKQVQNLLKLKANMYATFYDTTALYMASKFGHEEVVKALLDNGMDIDYVFKNTTALTYCLYFKNYHGMEILIKHGANVNFAGLSGVTLLMYAVERNPLQFAELLIKSGADVNAQDDRDHSALFYALRIHRDSTKLKEKVSLLLHHGANVNHINRERWTPLMKAVQLSSYHRDIIKALLDFQPDMNAQDLLGDTAAHLTVKRDRAESLEMLADKGADLNIVNFENRTPLMAAFRCVSVNTVKALIRYGATINKHNLHAVQRKWREDLNFHMRKICKRGKDYTYYFQFMRCAEALFEGVATPMYFSYLDTFMLIFIKENEFKLLTLLVKNSAHPNVVNLSTSRVQVQFPQKLLIDAATVCNLRVSPMCLAILVGLPKIVSLFAQTSFFVPEDVQILQHLLIKDRLSEMFQHRDNNSILDDLSPEKWSLRTWSKLAVLRLVGYGNGRKRRVRKLPIPRIMQEELLYKNVSFIQDAVKII